MSYDIQITAEAENDLREIFEYIARDLQAVQNAASQLDRLEQGIYSPEQMPNRFRIYESGLGQNYKLHVMPIDHYLVFYEVDSENGMVIVARVLYGGRNIENILK